MSMTLQQVEEIAALARLDLSKAEKERFRDQLSAILDYAQKLQALDTENIPPTAQVTGLVGVMREDVISASFTQDEALANAPQDEDGFFVVPTVLEES